MLSKDYVVRNAVTHYDNQLQSHLSILHVCLNILRANLIAARVDLSVQKYPGVVAAPLVIGTIAGSGGKLLQDGIQMACGTLQGTPHVLPCTCLIRRTMYFR